jgi:hypothetical protein
MVLRKTFGPKRDEVTRKWRRLHHEELYDLYSSPIIIRVINQEDCGCRGMWHVWGGEVPTGLWWGNLWERDHLEDIDVDGRIILKWIF